MMYFRFNNLKIRTKLLLIYSICVLLPIILTDAIILSNVNQNSKQMKMRDLQYLTERVEYNMREVVVGSIMFTYNIYSDETLDKFLNKRYESLIDYYDEYYELQQNGNLNKNYNYGLLSKIEIYVDNDTILNGGKIIKKSMAEDTDWYKAFQESGEDIFLYTYYDEAKMFIPGSGTSRTISIIRKLNNFRDIGVEKFVKIDIDYNVMLRDVLNEKIYGEIFVRNQEYILFSNQPNVNNLKEYTPSEAIDGEKFSITRTFKAGNQEWEILVKSEDALFWDVILRYKGLLLLIMFNLFIPTIMIVFFGRSINKRLSIVVTYMDKVKKEQFEEIKITEGEDEIGKLVKSYNLMVLKIKDLIEVVFKGKAEKQALELSKKQAELKAIQSQVNPHFLFNTLETIRMRSLIKRENETADIIGELAVLFRKSMDWGSDYITINEEMIFIEKYINIQKYRFGDKIKFDHYIMEECKQYKVPKLAISTFIENACIHGIEAVINLGVISLNIIQTAEYLNIEISDNGKGFEKERLEEIRWMIEHADSKMLTESKSTGMLNAFLRFKLFCDGNVLFEIDSEPDNGTDILIQIPLSYVNGIFSQKMNRIVKEEIDD
ncbi:MAG TPA: histidine kinase [Mobilitalea sp.]|nr:histidine kinase [Mobilitalea sp.]